MKINSQSRTLLRVRITTCLSLLALLTIASRQIHAQQWTSPDASNSISNTNSGNVGVGNSSPAYKLDVSGTVNATGGFQSLNSPGSMSFRDGDVTYRAHALWIGNTNADGGKYAGITNFPGANTALVDDGIFFVPPYTNNWNQWVPTLSIRGTSANGSGNVGIGITTPGYKLDVQGGQVNSSGGFCIAGDCKTAWSQIGGGGSSQWSGTGPIYYNGGNVGISVGTGTPTSNLQIGTQTSGSTPTPTTLSLGGSFSNSAGTNLKLKLYDDGVVANTYGIGVSSASMDFGVHSSAGYHWYAGGVNKMTLSNNGDLSVSGNISAKYQDVAEWVPSSEKLSAGTVVVLDSTKSNQVTSSTTSYDTRVAGVISEQPGIALGEKSDGKVLVATTGRVRVKVEASKGAINIGDLLVTSDVPGLAMKSEPVNLGGVQIHRPGTLIGKALEPLEERFGKDSSPAQLAINQLRKRSKMKTEAINANQKIPLVVATVLGMLFLITGPPTVLAQQWTNNGNNISNTNSGNVSITGDEPSVDYATLRVKPTVTHGGIVIDSATNASQVHLRFYKNGVPKWQFRVPFQQSEDLRIYSWAANADVLSINPAGNVGIGTTSPAEKLVTVGNILGGNITNHTKLYSSYDSQSNVIMELGYGTATSDITPLASFVLSKNLTSPNNALGVISFANSSIADGNEKRVSAIGSWTDGATNSGTLQFYTTNAGTIAERMRINSSGNVGIGTTTPGSGYKLDVNGEINATGLRINGTPISSGSGSSQWTGSSNIYFNSGNVGIGTTSPLAIFDVRNTDGYFYAGFGYGANKETYLRAGNSVAGIMHIGDLNTGKTLLQENGGNVGIGTPSPNSSYKLDVNGNANVTGNMNVTGNISAKYQDVAEWVPASEQLVAGTVVVLDANKSNQVTSSTTSYDTRVAGVISEQPGITLGEKSDKKVLVATTGRVRVKVDASKGAINIGDLLVTSDMAGIAMKSEPVNLGGVQMHRPGTLIGKALEPLVKGSGTILVLLSLQ